MTMKYTNHRLPLPLQATKNYTKASEKLNCLKTSCRKMLITAFRSQKGEKQKDKMQMIEPVLVLLSLLKSQ